MSESFSFFQTQNESNAMIRGSLHFANSRNAPWFIFCHGFTGQRMGPGYLFVKIARSLAEQGFSSLRFDFCGSGESDGLFADMNIGTMQTDLLTVTTYLRERHSPSRLILLGHSFGGMIAALCAQELLADGLVLLSPVGDPSGLIQRRRALLELGPNADGYYENGPHLMSISFLDGLRELDPVRVLFGKYRGNLLLIQGDSDSSISVRESGRYVHQARKSGADTEYHIFKGADHTYSTVSDVKMLCGIVGAWAKERFL